MMARFIVSFDRTVYERLDRVVEANNADEAWDKAVDMAESGELDDAAWDADNSEKAEVSDVRPESLDDEGDDDGE
jgi:hypothetical protein